jgi:NADPH-dependent curcumin reductase CurA
MTTNRRIVLAQRPDGMISADCFTRDDASAPDLADGEALVKVEYVSLDPTMRGWITDEPSYLPPVGIGEVMRSAGAGTVVESKTAEYPVGTKVMGLVGWQDYAIVGGPRGAFVRVLDADTDLADALSVYGTTGLTAYFGIVDIGQPKPGETFVVSGAAGGVGSVAGQIAKVLGCRVVGIAGTEEKCEWISRELGFDAAVNYRTEDVAKALAQACPEGIDVYFDNVGGEILDAALGLMNNFGRIVACGMISQYNNTELAPGPRNISNIVGRRLKMQGLILLDHLDRFDEAAAQLRTWIDEGRLQSRVHLVEGLDEAPRAVGMLFTGENIGKLVVRV